MIAERLPVASELLPQEKWTVAEAEGMKKGNPLLEHADCLMCARGILRTVVPPRFNKPISLRCSAGSTILTELNDECIGVEIEDAIRLNATMMAVMCAIGGTFEALTIRNMCKMIETGLRYGIPTLGVNAVGKELTRQREAGSRLPALQRPQDS